MKRAEQQQCIDAFNKKVGRAAPAPVQFPRPPATQPSTAPAPAPVPAAAPSKLSHRAFCNNCLLVLMGIQPLLVIRCALWPNGV